MTIHQLILNLRQDAGESSQRVADAHPPTYRSLRALDLFAAGLRLPEDSDQQLRLYKKAVEIDPGFVGAYFALSALSQNMGRYADAERFAEEAFQSRPKAVFIWPARTPIW